MLLTEGGNRKDRILYPSSPVNMFRITCVSCIEDIACVLCINVKETVNLLYHIVMISQRRIFVILRGKSPRNKHFRLFAFITVTITVLFVLNYLYGYKKTIPLGRKRCNIYVQWLLFRGDGRPGGDYFGNQRSKRTGSKNLSPLPSLFQRNR